MNSGSAFSLVFCTLNRTKKTGGELLRIEAAYKHYTPNDKKMNDTGRVAPLRTERKPHHDYNGTVNIKLPNHDMIKVHTYLITEFNGKEVIL